MRCGSLQDAVDNAVEMIKSAVKAFDLIAEQLLARHLHDTELTLKLQKYVDGCRYACTANLNWRSVPLVLIMAFAALTRVPSLCSGRYQFHNNTTCGGITLTL